MSGDQWTEPPALPAKTPPTRAGSAAWRGAHGTNVRLRRQLKVLRRENQELLRGLAQLQGAAQAGLLAGGLAHDLANLLCTLIGGAELAVQSDDAERLRRAVVRTMDASRRAADVLREFVQLTKGAAPQTEIVRVSQVLTRAHALARNLLREKDVAFVGRMSADDRAVCNPSLLLQTILNLFLNAVDAMRGGGGLIEARVARYGDRVWLEFEDDGPGVPEEIEDRIFEPFVSMSSAGHDAGDCRCGVRTAGTGLGLYISRRMIEEMGGSLTFSSARGRGALFRVTLLAADPPSAGTGAGGATCR
ncbi:MAG: sensor histidine kinase [Planctomycetota bacterium]